MESCRLRFCSYAMSNLPRPQTNVNPDLQIFPGYNSAVNAVTRPNQVVWTTQYFVDRWMPLLGGNGTMIVLALRRAGFLDRRTGERRDEIIMSRTYLAALAGISEDTLTREFSDDRKTGKPRNPWLFHFVRPRHRTLRNSRGQMQQIENAYWVSMDDPVHPDDWPLVEAVATADGWQKDKAPTPEPQNASSVPPGTHSAPPGTHSAVQTPHFAAPETHFASPLKNYSSLPKNTFDTTYRDAGCLFVVDSKLDFEDQDKDTASPPAPAPALASAPASAPAPEHRRLVGEMVSIGMAEPVAEDYAAKWPEECRRQVDFYEYVDKDTVQSPGGFLRRAIEERFGPPAGWNTRQKELAQAEATRKKQDDFNRGFDAKEAVKKKAGDRDKTVAEVMLARLSQAEIESLDHAVRTNVAVKGKINRFSFAANKEKLLLAKFYALPETEQQTALRKIVREMP